MLHAKTDRGRILSDRIHRALDNSKREIYNYRPKSHMRMKTYVLLLIGVITLLIGTVSCTHEEDKSFDTFDVTYAKVDAEVNGVIRYDSLLETHVLDVVSVENKWWDETDKEISLCSYRFIQEKPGSSHTIHVTGKISKFEESNSKRSYYDILFEPVIESRSINENGIEMCAVYDETPLTPLLSRSSYSDLTQIVLNMYVHFALNSDGSGLSQSTMLPNAQKVVKLC